MKTKTENARLWILYTVIITTFALCVFFIYGALATYKPFHFQGYQVIPAEVCPGQPVEVTYKASIEDGPYTLEGLEGSAYWVFPANGKPYNSDVVAVDELKSTGGEVEVYESPVQRVAPLTPGPWKVGAEYNVTYKIFGLFTKHQPVNVVSEDYTVVKSYGDPSCFTGTESVQGLLPDRAKD